ncbi:MazG-like family protein [Streptococcus dysgalactiae]|uniref:MazG-like family protein n=1 Tax=Streptococcus dysgalactiae TaxID=1334 RepID=UPI001EF1FADB|nr:MazG-like family protein [Streptococcus dysgalactiae]
MTEEQIMTLPIKDGNLMMANAGSRDALIEHDIVNKETIINIGNDDWYAEYLANKWGLNMTKTLEEKVEQWFIDRNLHEANPVKQFQKLMEETGELFEGIAKNKPELIYDALGDMQVVLIGLEQQIKNGVQIETKPQELDLLLLVSSLGEMANKIFKHIYHKETKQPLIRTDLLMLHSTINALAIHNLTTADTCLSLAYDEIKDRKGKMIDGVFIKEADL